MVCSRAIASGDEDLAAETSCFKNCLKELTAPVHCVGQSSDHHRFIGKLITVVASLKKMHKRYIFLHQVKTAGKTLEKFLLRKFGEAYCKTTTVFVDESLDNIFDILKSDDQAKIERINQADAISGHFPYGLHEMLEGESRYFTLLRDPVSRIRSFYAYSLTNHGSRIMPYLNEKQVSFEQFVQMDKADIERSGVHELNYVLEEGQAKIIAGEDLRIGEGSASHLMDKAKANIARDFDFVGTTEFFDDSFIEISKLLGFGPFNLYITQNRTQVQVQVSDEARKVIHERNPIDCALHGHYMHQMQHLSDSVLHKVAKSYLKLGTTAADFYVKMRS